jgi:outer membrane autotransporter protein
MKTNINSYRLLSVVTTLLVLQASFLGVAAQTTIYQGSLYLAAPGGSILAQEGVPVGDSVGVANPFGGYTFAYQNPVAGGASISGNNYGAEYFAAGNVVTSNTDPGVYTTATIGGNEVEFKVTAYTGPNFAPAPGANDSVVFTPIATSNSFNAGIPVSELTTPGIGNGELTAGYFYAATGVASTSYKVNLGGGTVAETLVSAGVIPGPSPYTYASPNFTLGGTFTSTHDAILQGEYGTPITFSGSGIFATPNLSVTGLVNVTSGTLQGDKTYIGNNFPTIFGTSSYQSTLLTYPTLNSTLMLTGADSVLNASTYLVIGSPLNPIQPPASANPFPPSGPDSNSSILSLMNGAQANVGDIYLSDGAAGTEGDLLVNGSTLISTGFLDVGEADNTVGKVVISNGGKISDMIAAIGFGNNAQASATVTGSGSVWNNSGYVAVGYSGTSVIDTLTVTDGGQVNDLDFLVVGGQQQAGTSGNGDLFITSGGKVVSGINVPSQSLAAAVGFGTNSTGIVMIDGSGSSWDVKQRLDLGYSAGSSGTVTVQNGATLQEEGDVIRLGRVQGSSGTLTFDGSASNPTFTFSGSGDQLLIGDAGNGNFNVQGGARIAITANVLIGNTTTGIGVATVSGTSSFWSIDGNLTVGMDGTGTLAIKDGDAVNVTMGNVVLGEDAGSHGTLDLSGPGAELTLAGTGANLVIGQNGTGNLIVEAGATATLVATSLGTSASGHGTITVDGSGSTGGGSTTLTINGALVVGAVSGGTGSGMSNIVTITGGGQLTSQGGTIGAATGSAGTVTITGNGSSWDVQSSALTVGGNGGTGTLNISNQAKANFAVLKVGDDGGTGTVNVNGVSQGATQTALTADSAQIGQTGTGTINVNGGAQLNLGIIVAVGVGGHGTINLTDANTKWTDASIIAVGDAAEGGLGTIMVQNGASIVGSGASGSLTLNKGSVTVNGHNSSLEGIGDISLLGGNSTLAIQQGAQVSGVDEFSLSGNSTVTIDGKDPTNQTPSTLHTAQVTVLSGTQLNIQNSGRMIVDGGQMSLTDNVLLNITGSGELDADNVTFTAQDNSQLRVASQGTLKTGESTVLDSAVVTVTDSGSIWNVQGGNTLTVRGGGTLNVGTGNGSGGMVMVTGMTTVADGGSTLLIDGGMVDTQGLSLMGGQITIKDGGSLAVEVTNVSGGSDATIGSLLTVQDNGSSFTADSVTVTDTVTVSNGGSVAIGSKLFITPGGLVTVSGPGTVTVGSNTGMAGTVHVGSLSTLRDYGKINGNLFADIGSFISGAGSQSVTGSYINQGALTPGDDPGIFTVMGDFTQGPTGLLNIEVEGTVAGSPSGYGVLDVGGNAILGGTLELSYLNGFRPFAGEVLDFLNVNGTTTGTFSAVTLNGLPTFVISDTIANGVLTVNSVSRNYTNAALAAQLTPNQQAVGASLNPAANGATGDFNTLLTSIDNLGTAQAAGQAFDQLSPERLGLFRTVANENFSFFAQQLDNHLANLRDGMTGFDSTGFSFNDPALGSSLTQIKGHLLAWQPASTPGLLSDTTHSVLGGVEMTPAPVSENERWSTFINGTVTLADLDSNVDVSHSSYTTGGVTMGADYRLDRHWTVGALFGYTHTDADLDNEGSKGTIDSYSPGVYAAFVDKGWYANGAFTYGYNSYEENRNIIFPGVNRTATATPDGNQYSTDLDGGYEFHLGHFTVGPSAGLDYVHLDIGQCSETGAGAAGLNIDSQNADSLRSRIGFDARWHTQYMATDYTYHLSAHWQHEFMANSQGITSSLEAPGVSGFTVQGIAPDRDSALIDAGVDILAAKNVDLFLDYQTEAGESNFFAQSVQAGVKVGF